MSADGIMGRPAGGAIPLLNQVPIPVVSEDKRMAIDLYAGVGGWTLGLDLAGIQSLAAYEWWSPAADTHRANFPTPVHQVDIRNLPVGDIPTVDFVVGSPPCTQFSFANRGGGGDISDGLRDVEKFLEIVAFMRPKRWAMENVPRVAGILERELRPAGRLARFAGLVTTVAVVDAAEFGVPQHRRRMLAGNFSIDTLLDYRHITRRVTLGEVLAALEARPLVDPLYGIEVGTEITGTEREVPLEPEEERMNRESKRHHPVYNLMSYPDRLDRPSRTITATCTRVSRESIVIAQNDEFRRLSIRERATLQSFPLTFQFSGRTYGDCLRMTGNAIPPILAYYVAHALLGTPTHRVPAPYALAERIPEIVPIPTPSPEVPSRRYPPTRRFRSAIPGLRFGSGVRFELANPIAEGSPTWRMTFYFGTSKRIESLALTKPLLESVFAGAPKEWAGEAVRTLEDAAVAFRGVSDEGLQQAWTRARIGRSPFEIVDALGSLTHQLTASMDAPVGVFAADWVEAVVGVDRATTAKLRRNCRELLAGAVIGAWFNQGVETGFVPTRLQPVA